MSYEIPGVKIRQEKKSIASTGAGSNMLQCIIAPGPSVLTKTFRVVRGSDTSDAISMNGVNIEIASIVSVGKTKSTSDYNIATHLTDVAITTKPIASVDTKVLTWSASGGAIKPEEGEVYYATVSYTPGSDHYGLKLMTGQSAIVDEYGPEVIGGVINPISLGGRIALTKSSSVYMLKVKPSSGGVVSSADIIAAIENNIRYNEECYRIQLVGLREHNAAVISHVRLSSTPDEGMERVTIIAHKHTSSTFTELMTNLGSFAETLAEERVAVIYPDRAKMLLSDGYEYEVDGSYIAVELAATRQTMHVRESYTNMQVLCFTELLGVSMSKAERRRLAAKGVMFLDQKNRNTPATVVHGLSTNMSGLQQREFAIAELADSWSKQIRPVMLTFKGKPIDDNFMTVFDSTVDMKISSMVKNMYGKMNSSRLESGEIEGSPDSVFVKIRVAVAYPCNYIDVVVMYD